LDYFCVVKSPTPRDSEPPNGGDVGRTAKVQSFFRKTNFSAHVSQATRKQKYAENVARLPFERKFERRRKKKHQCIWAF